MDFRAPAEMYTGRQSAEGRICPYRRFATLAEAVRFAVEKQPAALKCTSIETDHLRLQNRQISDVYERACREAEGEVPSA